MNTWNNQSHIKVTIIATRYGWKVMNNVTDLVVFTCKAGETLVATCNLHHLTVCNPEALIPALAKELQFTA